MTNDDQVLKLSIDILTDAFDQFVGECLVDGNPVAPTPQAIAKARAYLPSRCNNAFTKKVSKP